MDSPDKSSNNDQAPDTNQAPGQQTPTRGYGRQMHEDGTHQDVDDASAAEQTEESPSEDAESVA